MQKIKRIKEAAVMFRAMALEGHRRKETRTITVDRAMYKIAEALEWVLDGNDAVAFDTLVSDQEKILNSRQQ